jgi:hypothetical protein
VAITLGLGLLAMEVGIRLVFGDPQPFLLPQVRHMLTHWGYKTVPLQDSFTGAQRVVTNAAGYRDDAWPDAKAAGALRVLAIGDSITFGNLADQSETFAARLGMRVRKPGTVEWLTAAVGGWNTIEERNFLRAEGMALAPDLVVLFFFYNDFDTEAQLRTIELSADGRLEGRPGILRWLSYDAIFYLKRSALVRLTRDLLDGLVNADDYRRRFNTLLVEDKVDLAQDPRIATTYSLLRDMDQLARAGGADFMVVFCPSLDIARLKGVEPTFIGHLGAFVRSLGATFVDAAPAFQKAPDPERLFMFPWDNHYSARGHELVSQVVAPTIERWMAQRRAR